jgi:hypothetical protein
MTKIGNVHPGLDRSRLSSTPSRFSGWRTPLRLTRNYLLTLRNLTIAICFIFLAVSAHAQTPDVDKNWTTVGSAGSNLFFPFDIVPGSAPRRSLFASLGR